MMHANEVFFSVIVPVYNVEKYLGSCLDSLLEQGLSEADYEIICIDDGSTDQGLDILKKYKEEHCNVRIITQQNAGVSAARNAGLKQARGRCILFCDSDDVMRKNMLSKIMDIMKREGIYSLHYGMSCFEENAICDNAEVPVNYTVKSIRYTTPNVCSWIFDGNLIRDCDIVFHEQIKYAEDTLFVCAYANAFGGREWIKTDADIYLYRQRAGSAMHTNSEKSLNDHLESMLLLAEEFEKMQQVVDGEVCKELKMRSSMCVANVLFDAIKSKTVDCQTLLQKFKDKGMYPYKLLWFTLKRTKQNLRGTIVNYFKFLFPFEWYYLGVCKLYKWIQKIKK